MSSELSEPESVQFFVRKRNLPLTRHFMRFRIVLETASTVISDMIAKNVLSCSVRSMFGIVGSSRWSLDLLEWSEASSSGIIAVSREGLVPIRSAFMFCGSFEDQGCRIEILGSSAFLASLACARE